MSANEKEIIDRIQRLDRPAKQRIFDVLARDLNSQFDMDTWLAEMQRLRAEIDADPDNNSAISALDLLDELRDEAS